MRYRHKVTGRTIGVSEGTQLAGLVANDDNWEQLGGQRQAPAESAPEPESETTQAPRKSGRASRKSE